MSQRLTVVFAISALIALLFAQPTSAAIARNTINPDVELGNRGRTATVTGPIECTAGDTLQIRLTVSQAQTGAWGEGLNFIRCTGELQLWSVKVFALGLSRFESGMAQACAFGITRHGLKVTDTRQWCAANDVTLH